MQFIMSGRPSESYAVSILRSITPNLSLTKHKGQAGKIAVIGGCREYTGAPYFSAIAALKIGTDLSHVFCTKDAAPVIKSYSPELIVHPILEESYNIRDEEKALISTKVVGEVEKWMERFDCLVVGPGLGRDPFLLECVSIIMKLARECNVPMVIDGDGLFLVTDCLELIAGYPLAVLTPNRSEYKRLIRKVLETEVDEQDGTRQLQSLATAIGNVTILRKGESDVITDGKTGNGASLISTHPENEENIVKYIKLLPVPRPYYLLFVISEVCAVNIYGSPRRCGGQGDILSGSVAVFLSWARHCAANVELSMNPIVSGCIAGSALVRKAAALAFEHKRRSTVTSDIIICLGKSLDDICPAR